MSIPVLAALPAAEEALRYGGTEGPDLTRYLVVCGVLLLVIGALAFGARRIFAGALRGRAAQRSLQVIEVLPLGGRRKLAVVRCYDRTFVLGLGEREIATVAELDPVVHGPAPAPPAEKPEREAFARALETVRESMARRRKRGGAPGLDPRPRPRQERRPAAAPDLEGMLG